MTVMPDVTASTGFGGFLPAKELKTGSVMDILGNYKHHFSLGVSWFFFSYILCICRFAKVRVLKASCPPARA